MINTGITLDGDETVVSSMMSSTERPPVNLPSIITTDPEITEDDFKQAMAITEYSVATSMAIIKKYEKPKKPISVPEKKIIPEPENISMEYLVINHTHVRNILKVDETKIKDITKMKMYPGQTGGRVPAVKFVKGLELNGLGRYSPNSDAFKRYNPNDNVCPDREIVKRKWQKLCLE